VKKQRSRGNISLIPALVLAAVSMFLVLVHAMPSYAQSSRDEEALRERYRRVVPELQKNSTDLPIYIESRDSDGRTSVDIYGIVDHPFAGVAEALDSVPHWCDIISLHSNIKACTYRTLPGETVLKFYAAARSGQSLDKAYPFEYRFNLDEKSDGYMRVTLAAAEGPLGIRDLAMRVESAPVEGGKTFIRFRFSYSYGLALRAAQSLYFATKGRNKVGFTVRGVDRKGEPVFVSGPRGALERNAARYYFAIRAFMSTLHRSPEVRVLSRLEEWYDLTSRHRRQLFEMEKEEYIALKRAEYRRQVQLQRKIDEGKFS
jgi:hypothetical protein